MSDVNAVLAAITDKELDAVAAEAIQHCLGGDDSVQEEILKTDFEALYRIIGETVPTAGLRIIVADGPLDAVAKAKELMTPASIKNNPPVLSGVGLAYYAPWVYAYGFLQKFPEVIPPESDESKNLSVLRRLWDAGVWDSVLLDGAVIVVRRPCEVHVDENGQLHNVSGPAIRWRDNEGCYADHGVVITPSRLVTSPAKVEPEVWKSLNTEILRVAATRWGWDNYLNHIKAEKVDTFLDTVTNLRYELYDAQPFRLLRKESPALKDGSQPWYCEPVPREIRTAKGGRRWQIPEADGHILSADEAERFSDFTYPGGEA